MSAPELPGRFSAKWIVAVFWLCILGSLTLLFNGYIQQRDNPNHRLTTADSQYNQVVLQRNRAGHYIAPGLINGYPVTFLLDTGATVISIPEQIATKIGLIEGAQVPVTTANGIVSVYQTQLDNVQLGGINMRQVQAHINPYSTDDVVLLGMSFMKHLDMRQRDGTLTLRVPD